MTKLKIFNLLLAQWLFVRVTKNLDEDGKQIGYGIMGLVWPLTGWGTDFKYLPFGRFSKMIIKSKG